MQVTVVVVSSIGFDVTFTLFTLIPMEFPMLIFVLLMLGDMSNGDAICFIVISTYECRFCTFLSVGSEKKSTRKLGTGEVADGS